MLNLKLNKIKNKKINKTFIINMSNTVLINATENFNLNHLLYLEILKAKGIKNNDIQIVYSVSN